MNTWTFAIGWVLAWAITGGLIIVAVETLVARHKRRQLMAAGLYPKPGTETDEDVQKLMNAGQVDMAIRCYRALHRVTYQQAKEQLVGIHPAKYGYFPAGFILGVGIGMAFRHAGLGMGLGLLLGAVFELLARKRRARYDRLQ